MPSNDDLLLISLWSEKLSSLTIPLDTRSVNLWPTFDQKLQRTNTNDASDKKFDWLLINSTFFDG